MSRGVINRIVQVATEREDQAFEAVLSMASGQALSAPEASFDPRFSANETSMFFLIQQEHKMKGSANWPPEIRDHEETRTEKMRKALQDKFGEHFDAWYKKVKDDHPHRA